ncbi:FGGY-family carbohydrate kinase [Subtercola boreus]|uniref:FGGY-family carbohydrate kinase n=1 Tax=Subtercola boreus TaxID=120213 RepID=UPI001173B56D|nr:FGGY family carbohydrate kinase [Subtercola boreus]TQL55744.1 xylulokinase [Subtercola boreus]
MLVYAVDVGTTNVKVVLYDEVLTRLAVASAEAQYSRSGNRVEFDPAGLFELVLGLIAECAGAVHGTVGQDAVISLTGQAESLVLNDSAGSPVRPAMSWLDDRATAEAAELGAHFGDDEAFAITGEPFPSATWPAAKLRWLRRHEPETLAATHEVLMVKDDLVRRFTGTAAGELTTRGFTYFWNVPAGEYWDDMLAFCGVPDDSLPQVVPAGTDLGPVASAVERRLPPARSYRLNAGALDHFAAMVGTGSYAPGVVSESAGTVLSLSMLDTEWSFDTATKVSFHPSLDARGTLLFSGADSGGVALEWYRREGLDGMTFADLEKSLSARTVATAEAPIFLPYLTGINPPDFHPSARGAFLGLELGHDRIDLAYAVEEGIAHLLRRNVDYLGGSVREIVSTGGGADSPFWSQLKADVCNVGVLVPDEREATCRGAAVLALVAAGELASLSDAAALSQPAVSRFRPSPSPEREARYRLFDDYLHRLYPSASETENR